MSSPVYVTLSSTADRREGWRERSRNDRADWMSLIEAADTALQRLRALKSLRQVDVITDCWKKLADEAWAAPSWREAARGYRDARGGRVLIAENDPGRLRILRRLMGNEITLNRAWDEMNRDVRDWYNEAPKTTYDAVEYELRTYGLSEFSKCNCQRRIADLSVAQLKKLMVDLQQRRGQYPAVSYELLAALASIYDAMVISNEQ
jgi:hypothetical protein